MINKQDTIRELCVTTLDIFGVAAQDLDNMVHDAASGLAEVISDEGVEAQVEFLIAQGYAVDDILPDALLEKEAREASDALDAKRGVVPN